MKNFDAGNLRSNNDSINLAHLNPLCQISKLRIKNSEKVIIGNLNINSLPKKFDQLKETVLKYVDVLVLTETKLDDSFPNVQFLVDGFSEPYRYDRNRNGGGIMIYIRDNIPSKLLEKHKFHDDMEGLFVELNFRKVKWLLLGTYHPPSQNDIYYFNQLDKAIDTYNNYEKILLIGDFNAETTEPCLESFLEHDLQNPVKENTCFKSVENPSCIDLILTNSYMSFQNTTTVFAGISDFHKLVLTVLKISFTKNKPKEIVYRDYKNFDSFLFNDELKDVLELDKINLCTTFEKLFLKALDKHAPVKKKVVRANHAKYISKPLRKAIMKRSYLEKIYLKKKTTQSLEKYKKQKNYCSRLYKKERKKFFNNLNTSFVNDNKLFWKTVKPFFSNKGSFGNKIKLVENEE